MPGAVFDEVRDSRHSTGNWLLPTLLCCAVMALWACARLATPPVQKQFAEMREQQARALEQSVAAGKTTSAEAQGFQRTTDTVLQPAVMRLAASSVGAMVAVFRVFAWAWLLWLVARRFLGTPIHYLKALEVAGLASMIAALATVVELALMVDLHPPGGGIVVSELDFGNGLNLTAVLVNLLHFWVLALLASGLARLAGTLWFRAALPIFIALMLFDLLLALLGVGFMAG